MRQTATAILISTEGEFILQHRDDKPNIASPGKIANFGGQVDEGEEPANAIIRELDEELELKITPEQLELFDVRNRPDSLGNERVANTFVIKNIDKTKLVLHEGQAIVYIPIGAELGQYNLSEGTRLMIIKYKNIYKVHIYK